jgi:hypothetical protein
MTTATDTKQVDQPALAGERGLLLLVLLTVLLGVAGVVFMTG